MVGWLGAIIHATHNSDSSYLHKQQQQQIIVLFKVTFPFFQNISSSSKNLKGARSFHVCVCLSFSASLSLSSVDIDMSTERERVYAILGDPKKSDNFCPLVIKRTTLENWRICELRNATFKKSLLHHPVDTSLPSMYTCVIPFLVFGPLLLLSSFSELRICLKERHHAKSPLTFDA